MNIPETCNYCGEREAVVDAAYMCRMYRESKWKIEKTKVAVPRCMQCKSIHRRYRMQSLLCGNLISVVLFIPSIVQQFRNSVGIAVALIWTCWIVGEVISEIVYKWYYSHRVIPEKFGIKFQENVHQAESIKDMQRTNWTLRDPRPND